MRCYISGQWIDYVDYYTPELSTYIKKAELAEKGIAPQKPGFWKKYRELIELVIRLEKEFKYTANYGVYDPEEKPEDTENRRKDILKWEAKLAKIEKEHPEVLKPKAEKPKPQIVNNYYLGNAEPQAKTPDAEPPKTKDAAQETPTVTPAALELRKKFKGTVVDENGLNLLPSLQAAADIIYQDDNPDWTLLQKVVQQTNGKPYSKSACEKAREAALLSKKSKEKS